MSSLQLRSPVNGNADRGERPAQASQWQAAPQVSRDSFSWSLARLRVAAVALLGAATPAAIGLAAAGPGVKWLCLVWLLGIACAVHHLSWCAAMSGVIVLTIDERGILDRRLMPRCIEWREIEAVYPVRIDQGHVVDLKLRRPEVTLAGTRWLVGIGAVCQRAYGVPALTLSMMLLDGDVSELLQAIARHRPNLLHSANRMRNGQTIAKGGPSIG